MQLVVERVVGNDVECTVAVGGELRSRKGLNLPGIELGISAFTERDRECLEFALGAGVDAVSQSFVERAKDIEAVRAAAAKIGRVPFIIAKIERSDALAHYDEILAAADGIMVARGDLGVEVPIEEIAHTQKMLITKANLAGKPVITATQMLESMVSSRLPTRAEATDVANAILDGTDCVMLSGESAMGKFPEEAVTMLAKIAAFTETHRVRAAIAARREVLQKAASADRQRSHGLDRRARARHRAVRSRARADARWHHGAHHLALQTVRLGRRAERRSGRLSRASPFPTACIPSISRKSRRTGASSPRAGCASTASHAERVMLVAGPSPRNPNASHRIELMRLSPNA